MMQVFQLEDKVAVTVGWGVTLGKVIKLWGYQHGDAFTKVNVVTPHGTVLAVNTTSVQPVNEVQAMELADLEADAQERGCLYLYDPQQNQGIIFDENFAV